MPVARAIKPEVWGIVERVSELTKSMSPQNLKTSKLTEQPIVYSILAGTRVQIDSFFKRNEKNGKYANRCVAGGLYDVIDLEAEIKALHGVIRETYLNSEKSNFHLLKEYIFASEDARQFVEDPQYLAADIRTIREQLLTGDNGRPKVEPQQTPTLRAMALGTSTPPPRRPTESTIEPTARQLAAPATALEDSVDTPGLTCGHPTKAGTPCKRKVKQTGAKCATHSGKESLSSSVASNDAASEPSSLPVASNGAASEQICGHPTKKGTPCKRKVKQAGSKCGLHQ